MEDVDEGGCDDAVIFEELPSVVCQSQKKDLTSRRLLDALYEQWLFFMGLGVSQCYRSPCLELFGTKPQNALSKIAIYRQASSKQCMKHPAHDVEVLIKLTNNQIPRAEKGCFYYLCMYVYVCMVITYSRVWINRIRLPILPVAS